MLKREEAIEKLKEVKCKTQEEKKNITINIKICEMQIKIRDRNGKIRGL